MSNIIVLGIAGGSGSGKTTLMKNLIARFQDDVTVLSHDNYYRPYDELTIEERRKLNYDDTDADVRLIRRIRRDVAKRGRSLDSVLGQYLATVKPMHEQFVEPSKKNADLVVLEGGKNLVALEMIIDRIQRHIDSN